MEVDRQQVVDPSQTELWPAEKPQLDPESIRALRGLATGDPYLQLSPEERSGLAKRLRVRKEAEAQVYEDQLAQGIDINELVFS